MYSGLDQPIAIHAPMKISYPVHRPSDVRGTLSNLKRMKRPMLVLGSQCMVDVQKVPELAAAIKKLGLPTWLQGMCRGLLGTESELYIKNNRGAAFAKADCIIIVRFHPVLLREWTVLSSYNFI